MANQVQVREFQESDGPVVTKIWLEGLPQTTANVWLIFWPFLAYMMQKEANTVTAEDGDLGPQGSNVPKKWMGQDDRTFFVATLMDEDSGNEEVVGCLGVRSIDNSAEKYASMHRVSVAEKHHRKGIATLLMQHAEDWARSEDCHTLQLMTGNPRARDFYQSIGYQTCHWSGCQLSKSLVHPDLQEK